MQVTNTNLRTSSFLGVGGAGSTSKATSSNIVNTQSPVGSTSSTVVTLSSQAAVNTASLPLYQQEIITKLQNNSNQSDAMSYVDENATTSDGELVDISKSKFEPNGTLSGVTYTANGLPVTAESSAKFAALASQVLQQKSAIFEQGKAQGLSAANIYTNIQQYMASQPSWYLQQANWYDSTSKS